jgi:hypothetical protein
MTTIVISHRYVDAMLVTNHVLSGAVIGARSRGPAQAFALGVASHFVLDAIPHWGDWRDQQDFLQIAKRDGIAGLAVMGTLTALAPPDRRLAVLAGMVGATFPDLDKPFKLVTGRRLFPRAVNWFHGAIQRESRDRFVVEIAAGSVLSGAAIAVVLLARRPQR